jgi:hypothetical protein
MACDVTALQQGNFMNGPSMIWLRRLAWVIGAVLLLWVLAWLAIPALLKWQLPLRASEALGRQVTLGDVSFQPWNMDLTLKDLSVAGAAGAGEPLLQVRQLHTNVSVSSVFRLAPVVEALEIDGLQLRVARTGEGHYDVDDLITRFTPKPDAAPSEPARFALYNVQVRDAQLRFDDRPVNRVHKVDALQLSLPFLSNLPAEVQVKVEPRLAFKLNGAPFDSGAQATPFAQTKSGDLKLKVTDLDLAPYLPYLPSSLPVRVTQGNVSADLGMQFTVPPGAAPNLSLKGSVGAKNLAVTDARGQPLVDWQGLQLSLRDVQPLARKLAFDTLRVNGLQVHAARDASGAINLLQLAAANGPAPAVAASAPQAASGASAAATSSAPSPWQVTLESLVLDDSRVLWNDAAVKPAATLQIDGLKLGAKQVQWPITKPIAVSLSGALHTQTAGTPALAEFSAEGPVTDRDAKLALKVSALSLGALSPYLAQTLVPTVEGQLGTQAQLDWSRAAEAPRLQLTIDQLTLDALKLREGEGRAAKDAVSLKQLALADVKVDLLGRTVSLGSVKFVQPSIALARDRKGRVNVEGWIVTPASPPPAAASNGAHKQTEPVWHVELKDFLLDAGAVSFVDETTRVGAKADPVRSEITGLRVAVQALEWQGERNTAPANVQVSARIGAPQRDRRRVTGLIDYKGKLGIQPLLANGSVRVERFPVQLFAPYFADAVKLTLLHAEAGYKGNVSLRRLPAGLDVSAAGDVLLGDVHIATLPDASAPASAANTDELLSWQSFALKGLKATVKPGARPQIDIAEASLNDFYSRLVVTEQGRLNLQDVTGAPAGPASAASEPAASVATAAPAPSAPASAASAPAEAGMPLDIRVATTKLNNGRVDFSDHFVRPNYSAALTELNGQLGAFSSTSREMATIEVRGRAAGTALLEITGLVNPTVKPLALDIRAKASDLELAPLSPYAGKYAGYAIERGKLSMDVAYKIDADGKLDAKNQVVLNQLTFGDKIESKDATKLPVLLAVALLKDRNGVIDINLPVSGSLNDPKFSVGGIIWQVIVNLLTKAITSPFSLLAGGGGGDDLSLVEFKPGTAVVAPSGASAIDKVAKALTERPALKMTVTGASDPESERDAFQSAAIESRLAAEQRREALRAGASASAASAAPSPGADERLRLLKQVYKDTEIPNKPRNLIGLAKDIPAPEMEALLKTRTPVTVEAMRQLALQRGIAVRDALIAKGLPSERLFLAAPKLRTSGEGDAAWTPRVQLSLSTN